MAQTEFKPLDMLKKFEAAIKANEISFVDKNEKKITDPLSGLIKAFEKADNKLKQEKAEKKKGLSDYLDSHEVHKKGQRLWQELMSAALRDIDRHPKGNSGLFKYVDAATKFEDMLYGLESYYRDHTLHSLWVYLIGVLLMGKDGELSSESMNSCKSKTEAKRKKCDADNLNWYLYNDIEKGRYPYPDILVDWAEFRKKCFHMQSQRHRDAIWCIMALCHDLGYSLAKLRRLNEKVQDVLKFFHITDFKQVGYSLDIEQQYLIEQFLELMAIDVRMVPGESYEAVDEDTDEQNPSVSGRIDRKAFNADIKKAQEEVLKKLKTCDKDELDNFKFWDEFKKHFGDNNVKKKRTREAKRIEEQTLVKCYRDDSTYWRLCKALEKKEHGILSAYLLFKTLGTFADTYMRGAGEEWGLDDEEVIYNVIRGDILFAIAQHEFEYAHIDQLGSLAELLILCDELEEFTRLGRQLQSRKYHDTAAETKVEISKSSIHRKQSGATLAGNWIDIKMTYVAKHDDRKDFYRFFARKCEKLCKLYSLGQMHGEGDTLYNPIASVTAAFKWKRLKIHTFEMKDNSLYGKLCKAEYVCKKERCKFRRGCPVFKGSAVRYEMECMDDKVLIKTKCTEEITLRKWLDVEEDE